MKKYYINYKYQRKSDRTLGHQAKTSVQAESKAKAQQALFEQIKFCYSDRIPYAIKIEE